ncbi:arylesterase [Oceanicola sp. 22II-s10i]|uniref:arylesterase n=1 Tax=Oceanicola sp. 22II-s10i TaxID=1317116 RepID=UPI000B526001|nr:arylesterase [Oceanicola sp. 22II-s10i]
MAAFVAFTLLPGISIAEEVTILALGDSLMAGYGLPDGQGMVPQMQAWLDAQGEDATLINAGVSGDTTQGGLARVEWSLTPEVDAMIVELGGNDLLRGTDPALTRKNLDQILSIAQARDLPVLLIGLPASSNYGPEYKAAFDAIYPELAEKYGALVEPNIFAGLGAGDDPAAARKWMQPDGLHPNSEGVTRIVAALGPSVRALIRRVD